jgi:hypothetical protein
MRTFLSYAWRVIVSALQIVAALYIFSHLEGQFEIVVVALLGVIYVSVLYVFLMSAGWRAVILDLEKDIIRIRERLGDDVTECRKMLDVEQSQLGHTMNRNFIGLSCLFLILAICLYNLFSVL